MFDASPGGRLLFVAWLFVPALVALLGLTLCERWRPAVRVRRFWCGTAGRNVEVTFVANTVRMCTAFEPVDRITCAGECVHSAA
jgi:hypothetical protein